jgi:hypothetical protein
MQHREIYMKITLNIEDVEGLIVPVLKSDFACHYEWDPEPHLVDAFEALINYYTPDDDGTATRKALEAGTYCDKCGDLDCKDDKDERPLG